MTLYKDDAEAALHRRAIETLAEEERQPVETVQQVYEAELEALKASATVEHFVPTFAWRRAVSALRRRERTG